MRFYNKANIRYHLLLSVVYTLIFIPLTVFSVYLSRELIESPILKIPTVIFVAVFFSSPSWALLCTLCKDLSERKRLLGGKLEITTAPLHRKREKIVHYHRHTRIDEYLCFKGFDAYLSDHTNYQLADEKGLFYLVHYQGKKEIKRLYSAKMYDYQVGETDEFF